MKFTIERAKLFRMLESVSGSGFVEDFGDRKVPVGTLMGSQPSATRFPYPS
jgi:hypothetical protein